jgi:hypothetical protein
MLNEHPEGRDSTCRTKPMNIQFGYFSLDWVESYGPFCIVLDVQEPKKN